MTYTASAPSAAQLSSQEGQLASPTPDGKVKSPGTPCIRDERQAGPGPLKGYSPAQFSGCLKGRLSTPVQINSEQQTADQTQQRIVMELPCQQAQLKPPATSSKHVTAHFDDLKAVLEQHASEHGELRQLYTTLIQAATQSDQKGGLIASASSRLSGNVCPKLSPFALAQQCWSLQSELRGSAGSLKQGEDAGTAGQPLPSGNVGNSCSPSQERGLSQLSRAPHSFQSAQHAQTRCQPPEDHVQLPHGSRLKQASTRNTKKGKQACGQGRKMAARASFRWGHDVEGRPQGSYDYFRVCKKLVKKGKLSSAQPTQDDQPELDAECAKGGSYSQHIQQTYQSINQAAQGEGGLGEGISAATSTELKNLYASLAGEAERAPPFKTLEEVSRLLFGYKPGTVPQVQCVQDTTQGGQPSESFNHEQQNSQNQRVSTHKALFEPNLCSQQCIQATLQDVACKDAQLGQTLDQNTDQLIAKSALAEMLSPNQHKLPDYTPTGVASKQECSPDELKPVAINIAKHDAIAAIRIDDSQAHVAGGARHTLPTMELSQSPNFSSLSENAPDQASSWEAQPKSAQPSRPTLQELQDVEVRTPNHAQVDRKQHVKATSNYKLHFIKARQKEQHNSQSAPHYAEQRVLGQQPDQAAISNSKVSELSVVPLPPPPQGAPTQPHMQTSNAPAQLHQAAPPGGPPSTMLPSSMQPIQVRLVQGGQSSTLQPTLAGSSALAQGAMPAGNASHQVVLPQQHAQAITITFVCASTPQQDFATPRGWLVHASCPPAQHPPLLHARGPQYSSDDVQFVQAAEAGKGMSGSQGRVPAQVENALLRSNSVQVSPECARQAADPNLVAANPKQLDCTQSRSPANLQQSAQLLDAGGHDVNNLPAQIQAKAALKSVPTISHAATPLPNYAQQLDQAGTPCASKVAQHGGAAQCQKLSGPPDATKHAAQKRRVDMQSGAAVGTARLDDEAKQHALETQPHGAETQADCDAGALLPKQTPLQGVGLGGAPPAASLIDKMEECQLQSPHARRHQPVCNILKQQQSVCHVNNACDVVTALGHCHNAHVAVLSGSKTPAGGIPLFPGLHKLLDYSAFPRLLQEQIHSFKLRRYKNTNDDWEQWHCFQNFMCTRELFQRLVSNVCQRHMYAHKEHWNRAACQSVGDAQERLASFICYAIYGAKLWALQHAHSAEEYRLLIRVMCNERIRKHKSAQLLLVTPCNPGRADLAQGLGGLCPPLAAHLQLDDDAGHERWALAHTPKAAAASCKMSQQAQERCYPDSRWWASPEHSNDTLSQGISPLVQCNQPPTKRAPARSAARSSSPPATALKQQRHPAFVKLHRSSSELALRTVQTCINAPKLPQPLVVQKAHAPPIVQCSKREQYWSGQGAFMANVEQRHEWHRQAEPSSKKGACNKLCEVPKVPKATDTKAKGPASQRLAAPVNVKLPAPILFKSPEEQSQQKRIDSGTARHVPAAEGDTDEVVQQQHQQQGDCANDDARDMWELFVNDKLPCGSNRTSLSSLLRFSSDASGRLLPQPAGDTATPIPIEDSLNEWDIDAALRRAWSTPNCTSAGKTGLMEGHATQHTPGGVPCDPPSERMRTRDPADGSKQVDALESDLLSSRPDYEALFPEVEGCEVYSSAQYAAFEAPPQDGGADPPCGAEAAYIEESRPYHGANQHYFSLNQQPAEAQYTMSQPRAPHGDNCWERSDCHHARPDSPQLGQPMHAAPHFGRLKEPHNVASQHQAVATQTQQDARLHQAQQVKSSHLSMSPQPCCAPLQAEPCGNALQAEYAPCTHNISTEEAVDWSIKPQMCSAWQQQHSRGCASHLNQGHTDEPDKQGQVTHGGEATMKGESEPSDILQGMLSMSDFSLGSFLLNFDAQCEAQRQSGSVTQELKPPLSKGDDGARAGAHDQIQLAASARCRSAEVHAQAANQVRGAHRTFEAQRVHNEEGLAACHGCSARQAYAAAVPGCGAHVHQHACDGSTCNKAPGADATACAPQYAQQGSQLIASQAGLDPAVQGLPAPPGDDSRCMSQPLQQVSHHADSMMQVDDSFYRLIMGSNHGTGDTEPSVDLSLILANIEGASTPKPCHTDSILRDTLADCSKSTSFKACQQQLQGACSQPMHSAGHTACNSMPKHNAAMQCIQQLNSAHPASATRKERKFAPHDCTTMQHDTASLHNYTPHVSCPPAQQSQHAPTAQHHAKHQQERSSMSSPHPPCSTAHEAVHDVRCSPSCKPTSLAAPAASAQAPLSVSPPLPSEPPASLPPLPPQPQAPSLSPQSPSAPAHPTPPPTEAPPLPAESNSKLPPSKLAYKQRLEQSFLIKRKRVEAAQTTSAEVADSQRSARSDRSEKAPRTHVNRQGPEQKSQPHADAPEVVFNKLAIPGQEGSTGCSSREQRQLQLTQRKSCGAHGGTGVCDMQMCARRHPQPNSGRLAAGDKCSVRKHPCAQKYNACQSGNEPSSTAGQGRVACDEHRAACRQQHAGPRAELDSYGREKVRLQVTDRGQMEFVQGTQVTSGYVGNQRTTHLAQTDGTKKQVSLSTPMPSALGYCELEQSAVQVLSPSQRELHVLCGPRCPAPHRSKTRKRIAKDYATAGGQMKKRAPASCKRSADDVKSMASRGPKYTCGSIPSDVQPVTSGMVTTAFGLNNDGAPPKSSHLKKRVMPLRRYHQPARKQSGVHSQVVKEQQVPQCTIKDQCAQQTAEVGADGASTARSCEDDFDLSDLEAILDADMSLSGLA